MNKKVNYVKVKNFLKEYEINILHDYFINKHVTNNENFDQLQSDNADTYFYKDPLTEVFLRDKKSIVEEGFGLELYETYSFWRCYTYGGDLKEHTDRRSCEISATVFIGSDKPDWPIIIENEPIVLKPGEAVLYRGNKLLHKREPFEGDYHFQMFLHYVDKNGPYADYKFDEKNENLNEDNSKR